MTTPPLAGAHATLGDAFAAAAVQFGAREAYVDPDERLTFAEWKRRADRLSAELGGRGVRRGDVVAIMLPSSADFAVAYAAAVQLGAVATGVNTRLGPAEYAGILERSGAAIVIGNVPEAHIAATDTATAVPVLSRAELRGLYPSPHESDTDAARADAGAAAPFVAPAGLDRSAPALIIWTSGTTGSPKGAWYDHAGLEAAVWSGGVMSAPFDRRLVATPFAHAGYLAKVWEQLAWGITFVVPPSPWSAATTADVLRNEHITVAGAVPTQWAKLLELPHGEGAPFADLRLGTAATAPASPELIESVRRMTGVPLVVRYAMTESPSISGTDPDEPASIQSSTVGRPQPGMQVRVTDAAGVEIPAGDVGSIRVRGACVMRGYWNDPERTAAAFDDDGWLRTGDLGLVTPAGHLVLTGRDSEMYIRGGYNVYPLEVERILSGHPLVRHVAVVGTPAPVIGEIGVAFVVADDDTRPPTLDELRLFVRERLADYKAPDDLVIVPELPLTAMLKVDKRALQRRVPAPRSRVGEAAGRGSS
ncbi:linear/branched/unsaturated fatty acid:CoA ligase LbuL [soil metagenome]